jgi:chromosome partitioning protein
VIPASRNLWGVEIELAGLDGRESLLSRTLEPLRGEYDWILVDCPPSLGILTLNALVAADGLLVPVQCEYLAMEGLGALMDTIDRVQAGLNPDLYVEGIVLTMHESRLNLAQQVEREIRGHFGDRVYRTVISRNVRLAEAPSHAKPIVLYDVRSRGCRQYLDLAAELLERNPARRGRMP